VEPEKEIFEQALDLGSTRERAAFLKGACGADAAMLERLMGLLRASEGADAFLPEVPQTSQTVRLNLPENDGEAIGSRIGRYKLLQKVGEGGCGVVYMAEQEEPVRRRVALKVIKLGMDTRSVIARFEAERQALAVMDHPNIAKVLDAGATEGGRPYFVMELVRGIRITDYCDRHNLSTRDRLELFMRVCHAIQHAHQKGIIHRDIKPSNILVTLHDGIPVPKVIDFGIAKATEGRLSDLTVYTEMHQFIGTPTYMSPEQAEMSGLDIDTRSDIYALGVLLYELLTGQTPFDAKELLKSGIDEIRRTIREVEPLRPSTRLSTMMNAEFMQLAKRHGAEPSKFSKLVRGDLDWIVMKCLEKDRMRRYETANGLAADIQRHLSNEPIRARPPSTSYRLQKWARRNTLAFAAGGIVTTALVLGITMSTWQAVRATQAERGALAARKQSETNKDKALAAQANEATLRQQAEASEARVRQTSYSTEMLFAAEEIEGENRGYAMELLGTSRPQPGRADLRSWEWRFLWAQCQSAELFTVGTHSQEIYRVAFLPDGRLACGDFGQFVKIWNPMTRKTLASEKVGPISDLEVSPDGTLLGAAFWASEFALLDATDLSRKGRAYFRSKVYHLAFSPRDKVFATAGPEHVALWSLKLPSPSPIWTESFHDVSGLAFAPDGATFAFATKDQRVFIFDATTRTVRKTMAARGEPSEVAFSPDGSRLAVSHWNGAVAIYEPATGSEIAVLTNHTMWVASLAFSRQAPILATSSADQRIRLWDTRTWKETASLKGHMNLVDSIAVSPDGRWLASGSKDRSVRIWNLEEKAVAEVSRTFTNANGLGFAVSPKAECFAMVKDQATLSVWSLIEQHESGRRPVAKGAKVLAISPDGKAVVLSHGESGKVWLHRIDTGGDIPLDGARAHRALAAFSRDGTKFAVGGKGQRLRVGMTDGSTSVREAKLPVDEATEILFTHDGRQILVAHESHMVRACDAATGDLVLEFRPHHDLVAGIALDEEGLRLATTSNDGTIGLWELATRQKLGSYGKDSMGYESVSFSRDGKRLAAFSRAAQQVKLWDIVSGREVARFKYPDQVLTVRFAADDRTLVITTAHRLTLLRAPTFAELNAAEAEALKSEPWWAR
jgi:serine/threonine protein kinase/WD40 repeat protein